MQYLNLRYTSLSDRAVPVLARALRSQSSLTILHLENVSLSGRNLILIGSFSSIPISARGRKFMKFIIENLKALQELSL